MGKNKRVRRPQVTQPTPASGSRNQAASSRLGALPPTRMLQILLGTGLLFRILYLLEYRARSLFYDHLMLDAQVYDQWAVRLASGEWLGGDVFYHAPLYPYLLAVFYQILGRQFLPIYLFQALLGLATLYLTYRVGCRCASPRVGLTAILLLLLYAPLPFFETKLMSTSLAVALSWLALVMLAQIWKKGTLPSWGGAGALIGVAALAHPSSLILAPVFAVARYLRTRRLKESLFLVAGTLLAISPATLHNLNANGGLVLISSQGGITFLQGNSPTSRGLYQAAPGFSGSPLTQAREEKRLAEKATGRTLQASEISSYWFSRGVDSILEHPDRFLGLLGLKLLRWVSSVEYSTEYSLALEKGQTATLWLPFLPFGFLVAGAGAGVWLGRRTYPDLSPLYLYALATLIPPLLFYVSSRYRIAIVPALAIFSAVAIERVAFLYRTRKVGEAWKVGGAILLAGGVTLIPYGKDHVFQEANVHYNMGNLLYDQENYLEAAAEYQQALAVNDFEFYRINLGNTYTRLERYEEAFDQYQRVLERKPRFAKAHIQWAKALLAQGREEKALERYRYAQDLGVRNPDLDALLKEHQGVSSQETNLLAARRAVDADSNNASFRNTLGIALQQAGDLTGAEAEYRTSAELDPGYEKARYNLGLLLQRQNRVPEALVEYEAATRLKPGYVRAHLRAAQVLKNDGSLNEAARHYRAVLEVEPANSQAQSGLREVEGGP